MGLPAAHRNMLQPNKLKLIDSNVRHFVLRVHLFLDVLVFLLLLYKTLSAVSDTTRTPKLTSRNRCTVFATFFANFDRVIGPGGLRKSRVGICRLHGV